VVARADGVLGEVVLRRRDEDGASLLELLVGGVLLMDDGDASTETTLARDALARLDGDRLRVLVGGLGLGFTAAAVLDDPRVAEVVVVEVEPALVGWAADGLMPTAAGAAADPRTRVVTADLADVLPSLAQGSLDGVLLDVDNGPGFLVHDRNARLYAPPGLRAAARALRPGGVLAVWCSAPEPALARTMAAVVGPVQHLAPVVHRSGRALEYALYLAVRGHPTSRGTPAA
jgi:spermidine synthase